MIGVFSADLGNQGDYTALSYVEMVEIYDEPKVDDIERMVREVTYEYKLKYLKRVDLGQSYPEIVREIKDKLDNPKIRGCDLVVDGTGVGLPVLQEMTESGLKPIGICITGGHNVGDWKDPRGRKIGKTVPKRDIVQVLQSAFKSRRLHIPRSIDYCKELIDELVNFKVKISSNGTDTYEAWRESIHDDLVLSIGMAVWYLRYRYGLTKKVINENMDLLVKKDEDYDPFNDLYDR